MWGRIVEIMTAVWIALSPFVFGVQNQPGTFWADMLIAAAIMGCAGLSYWHPTRYAHLVTFGIAIGLVAWGRLAGTPPPPIHQSHIVIGLFLMMIALVPNYASRPARVWQEVHGVDIEQFKGA
jgi:hypothetical protein